MEILLCHLVLDQQHLGETELTMGRSTCTVSAPASHLQLEHSVVEYQMLPITAIPSVLMLVSLNICVYTSHTVSNFMF